MSNLAFEKIARFVNQKSGIQIPPSKAYMVETRLTPLLAKFNLTSLDNLAVQLELSDAEIEQAVVDAMTTNESFFFRDRTPFQHFNQIMLPNLVEAKKATGEKLRIWCAAAATGQEPYSLAISIIENEKLLGDLEVEIIATDISSHALAIAQEGTYTQFEAQRGLSAERLITHFDQVGTNWQAKPHLKEMINFQKLNLLNSFAHLGRFDIIFCRNVLIYFDVETKADILDRMRTLMAPNGYLMLGAAETLIGITTHFAPTQAHQNLFQPV
jgi:chemotaxis protein methyltransferase CheR